MGGKGGPVARVYRARTNDVWLSTLSSRGLVAFYRRQASIILTSPTCETMSTVFTYLY